MSDDRALHASLTTFVRRMTEDYDVGDVLFQLADQVAPVLSAAAGGVTLTDPSGGTTHVAYSDSRAEHTERIESTLEEGPCVHAIQTCTLMVVPDLEEESRWPRYRNAVLPVGWRTALGVPITVRDRCIGGLDVYDVRPREWSEQELASAQLLADMAASYIVNARALEQSRSLAEQLQRALDSRVVIEQAKGMLAATLNIDVDKAFELLRSRARSTNTKLHDLARQVVDQEISLTV